MMLSWKVIACGLLVAALALVAESTYSHGHCVPTKCPHPGQVFSLTSCQCECPKIKCPSQHVQNPITCNCECSVDIPKYCNPPQVFNPKLCRCECPNVQRCRPPYIFHQSTCDCSCPRVIYDCPWPQVFDNYSCQCVCPADSPTCTAPHYFNETTCSCQCPRVLTCPEHHRFDPSTCKCKCVRDPWCKPNFIFDIEKCECDCTRTCPTHYKLDPKKCECVCNRQCPAGYKASPNCTCVPLTCSNAATQQECFAAKCDHDRTKSCFYNHAHQCVCPCCVTKYSGSLYRDWCLARSAYKKNQCDTTHCKWSCY